MGRKKPKYYAWIRPDGNSGICDNWEDCQKSVLGWRNIKYQGFKTYSEAWKFAYPNVPESEIGQPVPKTDDDTPPADEPTATFTAVISGAVQASPPDDIQGEVLEYCMKYGFGHLSDAQKRAVQSVCGKTLLFAVPGSGKTTVIIARTGYMIYSCEISPKEIMSLTFTKAAANEMRERFCMYFQTDTAPDFRTIHSLCYSVILPKLKLRGFDVPKHLIGEADEDETEENKNKYQQDSIFREVFRKFDVSFQDFDAAMDTAATVITGIKNSMMERQSYKNRMVKICKQEISIGTLFDVYQTVLRERECMDYDDLLIHSLTGLREHPQVADELRMKYRYWSVDEAQDNSLLQFVLLDLICGDEGNLFMVGDDDQSIYSFRGADPSLLLQFGMRPNVKTLIMGVNYRSDCEIISAARSFVETNKNRAPKELVPFSDSPGKIVIPQILKTESEQYSYIIQAAGETVRTKTSLAVLYRLNISSLPLIVHLHRNGIEYEAHKGVRDILKSKHIRDIWKIMYFAADQTSWKAFSSCRKALNIFFSKETEAELEKEVRNRKNDSILRVLLGKYQDDNADGKNDGHIEKLTDVIGVLDEIRLKTPSEAVIAILDRLYAPAIDSIGDRMRIYSLLSTCDQFRTIEEFIGTLNQIIRKENKKDGNSGDPADFDMSFGEVATSEKPAVVLSTMHSSKGREFDRVIIIDTFEEMMPGKPHGDALIYDPEEERRLFYVAVTRAAHSLDILTVDRYHGNPETVSSFIAEFAYFCECDCTNSDIQGNADQKPGTSTEVVFEPNTFYAVRVGRKPGVYYSWAECQEQINKYSGAEYKSFDTLEEAAEFAGITPDTESVDLKTDIIDGFFVSSGGVAFNHPVDLPEQVTKAIYDFYGVPSLTLIQPEKLQKLVEMSRPFGNSMVTDYSLRAESYMLAYMPVNFYKIWKPLGELCEKREIPIKCRVLELGAGPGTATLGLLYFYILLAENNPDVQFDVEITAVEREKAFRSLFEYLTGKMLESIPTNLHAGVCFVCRDALKYTSDEEMEYNILLESNMMNSDENICDEAITDFLTVASRSVSHNGYTLMVEPGKNENVGQLNRVALLAETSGIARTVRKASKLSTDVSEITICRDALKAGLRYKKKAEHWFSYMILQNGVTEV